MQSGKWNGCKSSKLSLLTYAWQVNEEEDDEEDEEDFSESINSVIMLNYWIMP